MLEELKEKYTKIILWFLGLLAVISLLAHFSLSSLIEEEAAVQEENEQMLKVLEKVKEAEQQQTQDPDEKYQVQSQEVEEVPQQEIILEDSQE